MLGAFMLKLKLTKLLNISLTSTPISLVTTPHLHTPDPTFYKNSDQINANQIRHVPETQDTLNKMTNQMPPLENRQLSPALELITMRIPCPFLFT